MEESRTDGESFYELQAILDSISEPIVLIDEDYRLVRVNYATLVFVGAEKFSSVIGKKCYSTLYNRENICPYCPIISYLQKNKNNENPTSTIELDTQILLRKNEKTENIYISFFPFRQKEGTAFSFVEKISNITKEKEKEEENLRLRNLASLGIMISGVAHELNNPLTGINLTIQNLSKEISKDASPSVKEKINSIEHDLKRASSIVSDIISFAKPQKIAKTYSDISETIYKAKETIERLYPGLCSSVSWEINRENETEFYFNAMKMERLFINLFRNSIQAIDYKKGKIAIEIKKKKNNYQIVVEDNGGGISSDIIDKIFDPFFTNKKDGIGTGLGLSVSHSIVKEHGGKINVKSYDNKTRFIISIPASDRS